MAGIQLKKFSIITNAKERRVSALADGKYVEVKCPPGTSDADCRDALINAAAAAPAKPVKPAAAN